MRTKIQNILIGYTFCDHYRVCVLVVEQTVWLIIRPAIVTVSLLTYPVIEWIRLFWQAPDVYFHGNMDQ